MGCLPRPNGTWAALISLLFISVLLFEVDSVPDLLIIDLQQYVTLCLVPRERTH